MIESYSRSYLWSGSNTITKKALVAWETLCSPKCMGGLNLTKLSLWNKAAITKNYWDVEHKVDKLWVRWIHTYYIKREQSDNNPVPQQACWMIRKILEARSLISQIPLSILPRA